MSRSITRSTTRFKRIYSRASSANASRSAVPTAAVNQCAAFRCSNGSVARGARSLPAKALRRQYKTIAESDHSQETMRRRDETSRGNRRPRPIASRWAAGGSQPSRSSTVRAAKFRLAKKAGYHRLRCKREPRLARRPANARGLIMRAIPRCAQAATISPARPVMRKPPHPTQCDKSTRRCTRGSPRRARFAAHRTIPRSKAIQNFRNLGHGRQQMKRTMGVRTHIFYDAQGDFINTTANVDQWKCRTRLRAPTSSKRRSA